jgi:3-isopropylmalate dehydrogenase
MKVAILPRDGVGTEIVDEVMRVLNALDFRFKTETAPFSGPEQLTASSPR